MGLDLRLIPIGQLKKHRSGNVNLVMSAKSLLDIGRVDWDLGRKMHEAATPLPKDHDIWGPSGAVIEEGDHEGERCYGKLVADAYGTAYHWMTAKKLLTFLKKHWPKHPVTAYVKALPPNYRVVLDWH